MIEFSDMIKLFVDKKKCPDMNAVFLDEAQDLNPHYNGKCFFLFFI